MAVGGHGSKKRKMDEAIAALLSCAPVAESAAICGIHENTLLRMMQDSEFQARYRAARRLVLEAAVGKLQAASSEAVETLREVLTDKEASPSARVSAARVVLEIGARHLEIEDLAQRIEALETALPKTAATTVNFDGKRRRGLVRAGLYG